MIMKLQNVIGSRPFAIVDNAPPGWKELPTMPMGRAFRKETSSLTVLSSLDDMEDGVVALHVSVSRAKKLPTWEDLKAVKNVFMGPEVDAFHIIPAISDHVNLHNYTMHLWTVWGEKN